MSPRGELTAAAVLCAVGAALALISAGQPWTSGPVDGSAAGSPSVSTGAALAPIVPAASLGALAAVGAVIATRGRARAAVGVLLALLGLAVALGAVTAEAGTSWVLPAVLGGALQIAAGAWAATAGGRWPGLGGRRHPVAGGDERRRGGMWEALDRGEDPTL